MRRMRSSIEVPGAIPPGVGLGDSRLNPLVGEDALKKASKISKIRAATLRHSRP